MMGTGHDGGVKVRRADVAAAVGALVGVALHAGVRLVGGLDGADALAVTLALVQVAVAAALPFFRPGPSGFRNPWVYASDRSWVASQRVAAVVLAALAVGALVAVGHDRGALALFVLLVGDVVAAIALSAFSWWVWSKDPDRRPLG